MEWIEYERIRESALDTIRSGKTIRELIEIARIHSEVFKHKFFTPNCSTTYIEWVLQIESEYKKIKKEKCQQ